MHRKRSRQFLAAIILLWGGTGLPSFGAVIKDAPSVQPLSTPSPATTRPVIAPFSNELKTHPAPVATVQVPKAASLMPSGAVSTVNPASLGISQSRGREEPSSDSASAEAALPQIGPVPQWVEVEPVPEPSTGLLLAAIALASAARRRQRRRQNG